jgi:Eukaryotic aspartyl protease
MRACFDTGSANGWLLSSYCNNFRCRPGSANKYFTPALSETFENTGRWTQIEFGSGKLRGFFGIDDFRVGQGDSTIHIKN